VPDVFSFPGARKGAAPVGGLSLIGHTLYGATALGGDQLSGTIFSIDPDGRYRQLYSFAGGTADGAGPREGLTAVGSVLYGTTNVGGTYNLGTVFAYDTSNGAYQLLYSFAGHSEGSHPAGRLAHVNGVLYGTTSAGGNGQCFDTGGCGTLFSLDLSQCSSAPNSCSISSEHDFGGGTGDGASPRGSLTYVNDALYGTTAAGGGTGCFASVGCGTIFKYDLGGSGYQTIYNFQFDPANNPGDGAVPIAGLTAANGLLYGATEQGGGPQCGGYGCGTVFSLDPASPSGTAPRIIERRVHSTSGMGPDGELTVDGTTVYGVTRGGGTMTASNGKPSGTIYQLDTVSGALTVLYSFQGESDGGRPLGGLVQIGGYLYGVTYQNGTYDSGVVFKIKP
jgi:uncharacterized repeat protein (TIGR03803 family)